MATKEDTRSLDYSSYAGSVGIHRDKNGESKLWGCVTSDSMGVWQANIGVEITRQTTIWVEF